MGQDIDTAEPLSAETAWSWVERWDRQQKRYLPHREDPQWISEHHRSPLQIVCSECGAIAHFDPDLLHELRNQARRVDFQLTEERLRALPGLCPACRGPTPVEP